MITKEITAHRKKLHRYTDKTRVVNDSVDSTRIFIGHLDIASDENATSSATNNESDENESTEIARKYK